MVLCLLPTDFALRGFCCRIEMLSRPHSQLHNLIALHGEVFAAHRIYSAAFCALADLEDLLTMLANLIDHLW